MKYFFIFLFLFSCGRTEDQERDSAIREARYYLSAMKCSKALDSLDEVDFDSDDADYISTYAATQACFGGYKELDVLFGGNLDNLNSASLIASLAGFSSSNETVAESTAYSSIHNAITTLIGYDDDVSGAPSTTARTTKFGTKKAGDLSMQALYLLLVQIGKHFALYGNAGTDGTKGAGRADTSYTNTCIYSYTQTDAVNYINSVNPQSCTSATGSEGSSLLDLGTLGETEIKTRLCKGIIYFNNMMDILGNITLPGSDSLGDVSSIQTTLETLLTAAQTVESTTYNTGAANSQDAILNLKNVRLMSDCTSETIERIEKFYAIFFETIF